MNEQKWETTLKHEQTFNICTLDNPLFDITYGAWEEGQSVDNKDLPPLPYSMVITLSVENTPGIYNNIRRATKPCNLCTCVKKSTFSRNWTVTDKRESIKTGHALFVYQN